MESLLPSVFVLGLAALVALQLARGRRCPPERLQERSAAARALALTVAAQSVHFAEEAATGFHARFPELFGLPPMPLSVFVGFNLAWIGAWVASVPGVRADRRPAFFAAWFLAIAAALNGIAHPVLAVAAAGYFPGLVSSPVVGVLGVVLWRRLQETTRPVSG